jgi:hypothetical protein
LHKKIVIFAVKDTAMTTLLIDDSYPQAEIFLQYARTLPFAEVKKSKWQQTLDEGAVTLDEFVNEMNARIEKWPDKNA